MERLFNYSVAMDIPLKFAVYWARWRLWTLVDSNNLKQDGAKRSVEMGDALILSELSEIGDLTIGTEPPLKLRLITDPRAKRSVSVDGEAEFTISDVKMFSHDREIRDPVERDIAWIFMNYGDWVSGEPRAIFADDALEGIEFEWLPRERLNAGQRFELIGTLSSVFSRYYAECTFGPDGLIQTEAALIPDWFKPLQNSEHKSEALPLWRFVRKPGCVD